jgi:diguanylate cyclase (GGDEF)-like protein
VERLREELQRAARYSSPVSVFLIDIDNFKKINDTLGHRAGDQVLQYFAGILRDSIRSTDHAGRYGGEEFLVILPETDIDEAAELAERLRHRVELNDCLPDGETRLPGPVTVSLGIASFPRHALDVERLIDTADVAMYLAKSGGRNSVVTASTAAGPPPAAPPTH